MYNEPGDDASLAREWKSLEATLLDWWDQDFRTAREEDVRADPSGTLLYLPFPYTSAGGSEAAFPEMYAWDTYFVNLALLAYGRFEETQRHILNQLFMIERYGFVLNGNRSFYRGRSQPPLHADLIARYISLQEDADLARKAYPLLKREFLEYWNAPPHMSQSGLHMNRDLLEDRQPTENELRQLPLIADLSPSMLAEAETGLDFCPNFEGDARSFNPLITNSVLIRYLQVLAELAPLAGAGAETQLWQELAAARASALSRHCWDEDAGFYFEYNHVEDRRGSVYSLCGYMPLWAKATTAEHATRVVENLKRFQQPFGLSQTDRLYPSPYPQFEAVQWNYPAGWPPFQVLVPQALRNFGYEGEALECERAWLSGVLRQFGRTGRVFEKYNVVEGSLELPKERQDAIPSLHGWSTASALLAGKRLLAADEARGAGSRSNL